MREFFRSLSVVLAIGLIAVVMIVVGELLCKWGWL